MNGHIITGHLTGSGLDTEEAMRFAVVNDVRPVTERMPLEEANEALERPGRPGALSDRARRDRRAGLPMSSRGRAEH